MVGCPNNVAISPATATVTPADIHSSRASPTVRAEACRRWATSAAQTQPIARQAGTAAGGRSVPALTATTAAMRAVTPHAPRRRRLTVTGARRLSRGDIVSVVTGGRRFKTRHFGGACRWGGQLHTGGNALQAWKLRSRVLAWRRVAGTIADITATEPSFTVERFEPVGDRLEVVGHWRGL